MDDSGDCSLLGDITTSTLVDGVCSDVMVEFTLRSMHLSVTADGQNASSGKIFLLSGYIPVALNADVMLEWEKALLKACPLSSATSYMVIVFAG